jgi:arsenate reductase
LLDAKGVAYRYREYTQEPLSQKEIKEVLARLGLTAHDVLRKNDKAFKENGLTGRETAAQLIKMMAQHPTLLQRPIGIQGKKAVIGRPPERLLSLATGR